VKTGPAVTEPGGRLAGHRALVVGAGSGIGRAVVDTFAAEGARVATLELDEAKHRELAAGQGVEAAVRGDATTAEANHRAVEAGVDAFGGLDVVVNCVGRFDFYRGLGELSDDELAAGFDEAFRTNVASHLLSVKAALPHLRHSRGSVILTASTSSFTPGRGGILYVASKFAVRGAVLSLAHELAPEVRVNGVAPGGTLGTDLRGLAGLGLTDRRLDDVPDRRADLMARTPLHTALEAADVAQSYVFLASDAARGMTGRFLHPDGGMPARR
jgi:NAD(P)-dependent dehydrogenase (short-subunit alcohol dehydrogenase family)